MRHPRWLWLALFLSAFAAQPAAADEAALWDALRSDGYVALMRHAIAPGTGDPPDFRLGDCATQRNLSDRGRDQAARIGQRFRANRIEVASVFSSQWCRCMETAERLALGPVEALPELNSFFRKPELGAARTARFKAWLASRGDDLPLVLVTHQVNITELTGIFPASGEIVVFRLRDDGGVTVAGRIETD